MPPALRSQCRRPALRAAQPSSFEADMRQG
jgi:hypothetical protein